MLWIQSSNKYWALGKWEYICIVKSWQLGKTAQLFIKFQSLSTTYPIWLLPTDLPPINLNMLVVLPGILFLGNKSIDLFIRRIYLRASFIYLRESQPCKFVGEKLYPQADGDYWISLRQSVSVFWSLVFYTFKMIHNDCFHFTLYSCISKYLEGKASILKIQYMFLFPTFNKTWPCWDWQVIQWIVTYLALSPRFQAVCNHENVNILWSS